MAKEVGSKEYESYRHLKYMVVNKKTNGNSRYND